MNSKTAIVPILFLIGIAASCEKSKDPIQEMSKGVALLEQYRYMDAYRVFDGLTKAYPDWDAAFVNKGIAAFNAQGAKAADIKEDMLQVAENCYREALRLNPGNPHALLSAGICYNHTRKMKEALDSVQRVVEIDPNDPYALFHLGVILLDEGQSDQARVALEKVIKLQPSFGSAYWRLKDVYRKGGDTSKSLEATSEFKQLNDGEVAVIVGNKYGENGRYSLAIRDSAPPGWKGPRATWTPPSFPKIDPAVKISARGVEARRRPDGKPLTPAMAVGDLTGDGSCELVLCGEEGEAAGAPASTVIYTRDASGRYQVLKKLPVDGTLCVLGDIDSDRDSDLVLAGPDWLRFFDNDGKGGFSEKAWKIEDESHKGFPVRLYCADLDSDWDLDVICLRQEAAGDGKVRSRLEILNNNRDGTFKDISGQCGVTPFGFPAAELIVDDLDGDIDVDLMVVDGESGAPSIYENLRLWRYRPKAQDAATPRAPGLFSTAGGDFDGDGDEDLALFCGGALHLWKNVGALAFEQDAAFESRFSAMGGTAGVFGDFLGSFQMSLLVLDAKTDGGSAFISGPGADKSLAIPGVSGGAPGTFSALVTPMTKSGPAEVVLCGTASGALSHAVQSGANWIGLNLEGSRKPIGDKEKANLSAIGAAVEIRVGTKRLVQRTNAGAGGTARSPSRVWCGLAGEGVADYARILWPDGVLQSEMGLAGGKVHDILEIQRKPTSCPMLFAWDGEKHVFVGDFLGVGGLGYFELPGVYSKPDPTEYVLLPALEPKGGTYQLEIIEPMEECTYLDEFHLTVVDHPAGVTVLPEEMFAVTGPAPGFRLLAFPEKIFPVRATNGRGEDVTELLREVDRRYANSLQRDARFPGLSAETHAIDLEFDGRLDSAGVGEATRPYLVLHGFVEYGYSTSNFAAWQARAEFHAPTVSVQRGGQWVVLRKEWGFPAGYPRYMTVDLSGCLRAGDRRLRVETSMNIHWDQAFLGNASEGSSIHATDLPPESAELSFQGFPPEESPDGSVPLLYVYRDFEATAPIKLFPGDYTRFGDVRELLEKADDRFVIFGPGDALSLRVRPDSLPPLPQGFRRTFLAKAFGYCKDMDLYTAHPERVEPLPFRAMSGYPFQGGEEYPATPQNEGYRRTWNTRRIRGTYLDGVEKLPSAAMSDS